MKNCDSVLRPNSILPKASHIADGLWFVATQQILTFAVVCPDKRRETLIVHPPLGMIKLDIYDKAEHVLYCFKWLSNPSTLLS